MFRILCMFFAATISFNSSYFVKSSASAANLEDIIGGVIGGVLQNKQRKREQQRQERQYQAEQQRIRDEQKKLQDVENVRLVAHYKRVQTALKSLGFYKSKIDGDFGTGSKAAYSKFISAFNLPYVEPEFLDIGQLEATASAGWRSAKEYIVAQDGGFYDRDEYITAGTAGFRKRSVWQEANQKGFSTKKEYTEFLNSGVKNVAEFKANKKAILAKREIAENCLSYVEEEKWLEAERSCAFALVASPNDLTIASSHQRAIRQVDLTVERAYHERQAALDVIQPEEGSTDSTDTDGAPIDIGTAQKTLKHTNLLIAEVGLRRGVSNCEALYSLGAYQETLDECEAIYTEHTDLAFSNSDIVKNQEKLQEIIALAKVGVEDSNKQIAAEQEKLAFKEAKNKSETLVSNVTDYIGSGAKFEQPLAIAQALANLRKASTGLDTNVIESINRALSALVDADANYVAFAEERLIASKSAKKAALVQTRYNVEKMDVFVEDFVTKNLLDERAGDLLKLKSDLSAALSSGDEDKLKTANVRGRDKLTSLQLVTSLDAFEYTPDGVVVSTEDVSASKSNIELEKSALVEATKAGDELLVSIKKFSDSKQRFKQPLKAASSVALLRKALSGNEAADIQLRVSELDDHLRGDENYSSFANALKLASNASLANASTKSREALRNSETFLIEYISNNITAENIDLLIEEKEKISTALAGGTDENVISVENEFNVFAGQNGLSQKFASFVETSSQQNASEDIKKAQNGLAINAVNAALLDGHSDDLIVLRNSTASAPHVGKNILGNVTFTQDKASICWAHTLPNVDTSIRLTMAKLREAGAIDVDHFICSAESFLNFDLVAMQRGKFLAGSVSFARVIVEAFEEEKLVNLVNTSNAEIEKFNANSGVDSELLANELRAGVKDGYGIVQIQNGSNALCLTNTENTKVHRQLIADNDEYLRILLVGRYEIEEHYLDQAYVLSQRNKCGSIYGAEEDLEILLAALDRENQNYSVVPKWFSTSEFEETKTYLDGLANATEQELAKKSQERQARIALEKAKYEKAEAERFAKQALLRDKHVTVALGHLEPMGNSIKQHILQGSKSQELSLFDKLKNNITGLKQDLWKFNEVDYSLVDFGTADWQGREVTALVARFFYKSENATQGKHRTDCALVGYLIDEEFGQNRDPIHVGCDQQSTVTNWLGSRKFSSLWNIQ